MPRYIIKLTDKETKTDYYMEWSTIVDAPVTYGVSLKEFTDYYVSEYGLSGMKDLPDRMKRVELKGTSSQIDDSAEDLISGNRAGDGEKELSYDEIIEKFCVKVAL